MKKIFTKLFIAVIYLGWIFSPLVNNAQWTQKANFGGTTRAGAAGFSIGTKGYLGTGKNFSTGIAYNDFWEYNPSANVWTQKANVGSTPRWDAATFVINGFGYLGTGLTGGGYVSDFWKYNPSSNTWTSVASFGGGGRQGASAFALNGFAYLGTGYGSVYKSDFWKYDPSLNNWTQIANFGGGVRADAENFVVSNRAYMGMGWDGSAAQLDLWEYIPAQNVWVQKTGLPGASRIAPVSFSLNNKGYIGMGRSNDLNTYYTDMWEYDTANVWIQLSDFNGPGRTYSVSFSIGSNGYVGTGSGGGNAVYNDFYEFGQTLSPPPAWVVYDTTNSPLSDNRVYHITFNQATGDQWLSTFNGGLVNHKSCNWTVYDTSNSNIPSNWVTETSIDANGNVWLGTQGGGIAKFDGFDFTVFNTSNSGMPTDDSWAINAEKTGSKVWIGAQTGGLVLYDGLSWTAYNTGNSGLPHNIVNCIVIDSSGNKWIATGGGGLAVFNDVTWTVYNTSNGSLAHNYCFTAFIDKDGNIWVGTQNGVARFDGSIWTKYTTTNSDIPGSSVTGITQDNSGTIWIGTVEGGVAKFDGAIWTTYNTSNSTLPENYIECVAVSPQDNIWVGTFSKGMAGFNEPQLSIQINTSNTICYGSSTGNAAVSVSGGTPPYSYSWSNGATTASINNLIAGIYAVTISDSNNCSITDVASINDCAGGWVQKANFGGVPKDGTAGFSIGTKGYIGVGRISGNTGSVDFWEYDQPTNVWTQKANVGGPARWDPFYFVFNGKGYIGAGLTASGYVKDVWEYDPATNIWNQKADFGGSARQGAASFVINDTAYVGTGYSNVYTSDFWKYNPVQNTWIQIANFGGGIRSDARGFAVNNKGFVGTGWNGNNALNDFWEYDPTNNSWVKRADLPAASRIGPMVFAIGNKAYVGLGRSNDLVNYYKDFWEYNPGSDSWSQKAEFIGTGRSNGTGFAIGSLGYVGTGKSSETNFFNDFFEFGPCGDTLSISAIKTDNVCNGDSAGVIDVTITGGISPYLFTWSDGSSTEDIAGLSAGTFSVTATDVNGCSKSLAVSISDPPPIIPALIITDVSCDGTSTGALNLSVSGGISPYTILWSNNETTADIDSLLAGNYTVLITDSNNCIISDSAIISEPQAIIIAATLGNISCTGGNDGSINISVSGGTSPYSYLWSNGYGIKDISGLSNGTYALTVSDNNGCMKDTLFTLADPSAIAINEIVNAVSCNGSANGSVDLSVSGGSSPYTYLWSYGATSEDVANLSAGIYFVVVSDSNNCTQSDTFEIIEPSLILININTTNATCGLSNGSASANVSGGTSPYTYLWSNSLTFSTITGLASGSYSVTLTDNQGCTASQAVNVSNSVPVLSATSTNVTCNGGNNGSGLVTASGGSIPYSYSWSNGDTTDAIDSLASGSYTASVTDASGCLAFIEITITEPAILTATTIATAADCNGASTGSASAAASGGTTPYSYVWSNTATTELINGVAAGNYEVTITDGISCNTTATVLISEPSALSAMANSMAVTCNGASDGTASVNVTGGTTPYSYLWSNNDSSAAITGLIAGNYDATVTDSNGCSTISSSAVSEPPLLSATATSASATCSGSSDGSASVNATGGTSPYGYQWFNNDTTASITGLLAGTYDVTVTDANGCIDYSAVIITEPSIITGTQNLSICQDDSILLAGSYQSSAGTYYDTLISAGGCDSILVSVLSVIPSYNSNVNVVICPGDSVFAGGAYQNMSGVYSDVFAGVNGCDSSVITNLVVNGFANVISGIIYYNGNPITTGEVRLIQKNGNSPQSMVDVDSMQVNADGTYFFDNIPPGNYLVKALGDTAVYNNVATYADSTNHWQDAANIDFGLSCGDTISNANVYLIDFSTTIGFGNIRGSIINGGPGKVSGAFLGDPIPGLDVSLEQIPGGIAMGFTKTDINGEFEFANLEIGNYRIFVDIPGYVMDTLSVISYDSSNINLDYEIKICVIEDSVTANIQVCEIAYQSVSEIKRFSEFSVHPNPTSGRINIKFISKSTEKLYLEVVNEVGEVIQDKIIYANPGYNLIQTDLEAYNNGIYTLKLIGESENIIQKLIITR